MNWEFSVLDFIQSFHGPVLDKLMAFFTFLGEAGWFWILLCLVLLCSRKYRFCGIALCIALLINLILGNIILKPLVARPRPCWIRDTVEVLIRVGRLFLSLRTHHGVLFSRNSSVSHMEETGDLCAGSGGCHRIFPTLFLCSFSHGCVGRGCSWYSLRNPGNSMYEKAERHKSGKILLI